MSAHACPFCGKSAGVKRSAVIGPYFALHGWDGETSCRGSFKARLCNEPMGGRRRCRRPLGRAAWDYSAHHKTRPACKVHRRPS